MRLLTGFTLLLALQIAGEALVRLFSLAVPGPVLGLLLLLCALAALPGTAALVEEAAGALLSHLSLLFVPAGVGVVVHLGRLDGAVPAVALTLAASTLAGLAVTALVLQALLRRASGRGADGDAGDGSTGDEGGAPNEDGPGPRAAGREGRWTS